PRHRHRSPRRQADARRPARPRALAPAVRGDGVCRLPARPGRLGLRPGARVAAAAVADAPACGAARPAGAHPQRRALAQRGARAHGPAAPRLLRAAGRRPAAEQVRLDYEIYEARLRAPLVSAHGLTDVRPLVRVRLTGDDGAVGCGEAAPLESYDGVSVDHVTAALDAWEPGGPLPELPQAAAAIDLALWDLRGRASNEPVWRL